MTPKGQPERVLADRLQSLARERADEEARRIPWQRLLEARDQYIDWQEFCLWVRSILEVEERIPEWLGETLSDRCPGFTESEKETTSTNIQSKPLPFRLEDWIDNQIFGFAKQEGWFNAIAFYAIREPRYQRAEVCWSESVEQWKCTKPSRYPSFDEWKETAAQCDDTARLAPEARKVRASAKRVVPERLAEAVSRYIDWEALAYWARPAMEIAPELPLVVVSELSRRCPGFLAIHPVQARTSGPAREWERLMGWVAEHCFQEAKAEGWWDAVLIEAQNHPRAIRTMEFADHCDELWDAQLPEPYPQFDDWRKAADSYVESPAG
jgi:hypothetical protein